jgi:acylphosphatase
VRVRIHGRVQGVGFRQHTASRARSLGLGGWVANLADGSVEAAFEGPSDRVASMVEWARGGPSGAQVTRVDEAPETPLGDPEFRIEFAQRQGG